MPSEQITVPIPHSAEEIREIQIAAEAEVAEYVEFTIETPEEFAAVDAALSDRAREYDRVIAMQKSVLAPLEGVAKTIRGWFKPTLTALETTITRYKGTMGAYELERRKRERAEREAAAVAAETGASVVEHLTAATALAQTTGRATKRLVWRVERIIRDMLPAEYLIPDEKRIAAEARAHTGDDPPVIPGVVFRQEIEIGARR